MFLDQQKMGLISIIREILGCFHTVEAKRPSQEPRDNLAAATAAKSLQSCLTLCDPTDSGPPGSPVGCHFLLQCMKVKSDSEVAQSCPTPSDPMDCSL